MRRVSALAVGGALLLAGCDGGDGSERAERARSASATAETTAETTSTTAATMPTSTMDVATTTTVTAAPATGTARSRPSGNASSPPSGGSIAPGEPAPPSGRRPPPGRTAHPWQSYSTSPDGRTLTFTYYAGVAPCSVFDHADVQESSTHVVVTIYERSDARPDQACVMMAQEKHATVALRAPLGSRRVVDGAPTSPPPPSPPPPYPGPPGPSPQPPPQPEPRPPCCKNPHAVRWESYSASPDGRTLTFTYWSGVDECSRLDRVDVRESVSNVVVTIYERDVTNGNPCVAMAQQKHATATLQAPLGGRTVIDGAA